MKALVILILASCILTKAYATENCDCLSCIHCEVFGKYDPSDPNLKDILDLIVVTLSDPACLDGSTTDRDVCTEDSTCGILWGKFLVKGENEAVVMECTERFCEPFSANQTLAAFMANGCRQITNSPLSDFYEQRFTNVLSGPTVSLSILQEHICFDDTCDGSFNGSPADLCPPNGKCPPWKKLANSKGKGD